MSWISKGRAVVDGLKSPRRLAFLNRHLAAGRLLFAVPLAAGVLYAPAQAGASLSGAHVTQTAQRSAGHPPRAPKRTLASTPTPCSSCDTLVSGQFLADGNGLTAPLVSANGEFFLTMQSDGNLVLYRSSGGAYPDHALWFTKTQGSDAFAVMQTDGNLVVYDGNHIVLWALSWQQGVSLVAGSTAVLQSDGNFVVYSPNHSPVWWTGAANDHLYPGDRLNPGWILSTTGYTVQMQYDGNLVVYNSSNQPLWRTSTANYWGAYARMQTDGNFVVYSGDGTPRWALSWHGVQPMQGDYAVLQTGGTFGVYGPSNQLLYGGVPQSVKDELRSWGPPNVTWRADPGEGGNDFPLGYQTAIYAVEGGLVLGADFPSYYGGGGVVSIEAAPTVSEYYQHLSGITVHVGQQVNAGDLIGYSGGQLPGQIKTGSVHDVTCCSTGPHLEWGINGPWPGVWSPLGPNVDPRPYLDALAR